MKRFLCRGFILGGLSINIGTPAVHAQPYPKPPHSAPDPGDARAHAGCHVQAFWRGDGKDT